MTQPNILLITTDQQHYSTLGLNNADIETPNLDRLCSEGTRFDRAYCPSPVCTPSRASILTGQMPSQHGAWTIGVKLDEDITTIGELLHDSGYVSGLIGKAHFQPLVSTRFHKSIECQPTLRDLDFWACFEGPWYGFDHVEMSRNHADESHVGQHYALWLEEKGCTNWRDYFQPVPGDHAAKAPKVGVDPPQHDRFAAWELPDHLHYTTWTGERSAAFIERYAGKTPFFLWTSFHDPHPPYAVPEPWASMYDPDDMKPGAFKPGEFDAMPPHFAKTREIDPDFADWHDPQPAHGCHSHLHDVDQLRRNMAKYYGMVSFLDREVGRILDKLDALGITENTLVVFTTDHGHFLGQHGLIAKGPFHYEDLLRIPFIVRQKGRIPVGQTSQALQSLVDLAPSFLDAAGLPIPGAMQGVSQWPCWQGGDSVREGVICENRHNPVAPHAMSYVNHQHKITLYRTGEDGELFDLCADPDEVKNLWYRPECLPLRDAMLREMMQAVLASEPIRNPRQAVA
ncbi:sulfatase (plasmid) [Phaeobacter inhibens]|uniref:sulfatase family protein n=1 Tax=Phaeobacter inhibens TaxID=221822 RepID=UPI0009717D8F|nr:sulfatase-like hydrolase/transferase [Phaeobacter inhibens]APX18035.1 sulfatase [Phaeobacter inhibens]